MFFFFDRRAQELLSESGNQDERIADVGVSGEQLPIPLYCECRQFVKHIETKALTLRNLAV